MATKSEIMNKNVVSVWEIVDFNPNEGDDDVTKYNNFCVTLDSLLRFLSAIVGCVENMNLKKFRDGLKEQTFRWSNTTRLV